MSLLMPRAYQSGSKKYLVDVVHLQPGWKHTFRFSYEYIYIACDVTVFHGKHHWIRC
jgi:hypothetical protein